MHKPEKKQRTLTKLEFKTCRNIDYGNEDRQKQNKDMQMEERKPERK